MLEELARGREGREEHWDGVLTTSYLLKVIQLGTLVDNLTVDPATGDILAGCHPNPMKLLIYNPEDPPGSEVSIAISLN